MTDEEPRLTSEYLQKLYDGWRKEHEHGGELPKITLGDDETGPSEYYVDGHLEEIRDVTDPFEKVTFNEIDMMNAFRDAFGDVFEKVRDRHEPPEERAERGEE